MLLFMMMMMTINKKLTFCLLSFVDFNPAYHRLILNIFAVVPDMQPI